MTINQNTGKSPVMRLTEYLERTGETQLAFAKRSGVPQSTVSLICKGGGTRVETALKIIEATSGLVKLEDLSALDAEDVRRQAS